MWFCFEEEVLWLDDRDEATTVVEPFSLGSAIGRMLPPAAVAEAERRGPRIDLTLAHESMRSMRGSSEGSVIEFQRCGCCSLLGLLGAAAVAVSADAMPKGKDVELPGKSVGFLGSKGSAFKSQVAGPLLQGGVGGLAWLCCSARGWSNWSQWRKAGGDDDEAMTTLGYETPSDGRANRCH